MPPEATRSSDDGLRAAMKRVYTDLLADRERWARSTAPGAAERAVAYQSAAARVMQALDEHPPRVAQYLHAPHDGLAVKPADSGLPRENLGGLRDAGKAER